MTDEQLKAKKWDMQEEEKALKGRIASLENELRKFAVSWREMERVCSNPESRAFKCNDEELIVFNSRTELIASAPRLHFDSEGIKALFSDLQQAKDSLEAIQRETRSL